MKIVGIGVDYSNICKEYNTAYLDRDNNDPETNRCMKQVLTWTDEFLSQFLDEFGYSLHNLSSATTVKISDVASKRFLFYSLEKEITLQSYVISQTFIPYEGLSAWEQENNSSILISNDEDGGAVYFFLNDGSKEHQWIVDRLQKFSLDDVVFSAKR